ncbi:MAG TPA: ABC transporter permease [Thermodesulfobacteriota bacterium]|nr:ABC transporter permease [Thermodesulfobacteriota bacterium]
MKIAEWIKNNSQTILTFIIVLLVWHFGVVLFGVKEFILPTPIAAIQTLFQGKFRWPMNFMATFYEVVGGFLISGFVGVILGVAVVWSEWLKRTILPLLVFLNSLPKIAVAPLFMIWFGYGILPNILIVFLISFFPVVINTATGLMAVEEDLLDLVNYLHATKWQKMRKIQLPNSLPYVFSGLKIAATTAVTGAIVGEFVASDKGLGSVIIASQTTLATPVIFGSLILITVIGMVLFGFVGIMERTLMPWEKK